MIRKKNMYIRLSDHIGLALLPNSLYVLTEITAKETFQCSLKKRVIFKFKKKHGKGRAGPA